MANVTMTKTDAAANNSATTLGRGRLWTEEELFRQALDAGPESCIGRFRLRDFRRDPKTGKLKLCRSALCGGVKKPARLRTKERTRPRLRGASEDESISDGTDGRGEGRDRGPSCSAAPEEQAEGCGQAPAATLSIELAGGSPKNVSAITISFS